MPTSFKDSCTKAPEGGLKDIFRKAQNQWAQRMKDYRDCFIHYTPVDTLLDHYVSVSRRMGIKSEIAGQSESSGNHSVSVEATQRVALLRYIRVEAISRT